MLSKVTQAEQGGDLILLLPLAASPSTYQRRAVALGSFLAGSEQGLAPLLLPLSLFTKHPGPLGELLHGNVHLSLRRLVTVADKEG